MAQTKPKAGQFYGVSNNGTDGQFLQSDGAGGMAWAATITDPTITSIDYPGTQTAADPAGGESVIINGTLFASGITCTVGGTSAVTAFNSATQITITTPAKAAGPYTVAVLNSDGGTASQANFIQYSGVPVWSTAAGTLGNVLEGEAASFQVTATEGSDTIEYAVTTGTLPTGLSLATATGAITGTAPAVSADTTTTFSITATDDENQTSASRSFSITVQNDAPSNHFNTVLYTGNDVSHAITGVGFEPSLVWIKRRNTAEDHALYDSVRGINKQLSSNLSAAQATNTAPYEGFTSFDADGFTLNNNGATNRAPNTYVAWNFKAGGAAVANTDGTINSDVSVNNTLGFSIASYTGNGIAGSTVGHGLDSTPEMVIVKSITSTANGSWSVYHISTGATKSIALEQGNAPFTDIGYWNNTSPTASVFSLGTYAVANQSSANYIAYNFTSKPGFSKVGSYTGNGSTNGPMVQTGFEPAFLMIKTTGVDSWFMVDNKRDTSNPRGNRLFANRTDVEASEPGAQVNFYANGFQLTGSGGGQGQTNSNGTTYIYLAIAADGSTATPSLANSFDTELYTGNGGTQSITGTGFKPDLSWVKNRNTAGNNHNLADILRGVNNVLVTNSSNAEYFNSTYQFNSFNTDGITVTDDTNGNYGVNGNGETYVSWNWKAGGTPSINTDGSTTSLVSANQAAGFSIVQYTAAGTTIAGHGLSQAPELIIQRLYNITSNWFVYSAPTGLLNYLKLNDTSAFGNDSSWISAVTNSTFTEAWSGGSYSYINYCWHSVAGYSKVGSYTGGSSGSSNVITIGFKPSFLMVKRTDASGDAWQMFDSTMAGSDTFDDYLQANTSAAEASYNQREVNFTNNGFYWTYAESGTNISGGTYIYLALKEN